jgi:hypothetical protein
VHTDGCGQTTTDVMHCFPVLSHSVGHNPTECYQIYDCLFTKCEQPSFETLFNTPAVPIKFAHPFNQRHEMQPLRKRRQINMSKRDSKVFKAALITLCTLNVGTEMSIFLP